MTTRPSRSTNAQSAKRTRRTQKPGRSDATAKPDAEVWKIEGIQWNDAWGSCEWMSVSEAREHLRGWPIITVGYVIAENDDYLHLASCRSADGSTYGGQTTIPKAWIQHRHLIAEYTVTPKDE